MFLQFPWPGDIGRCNHSIISYWKTWKRNHSITNNKVSINTNFVLLCWQVKKDWCFYWHVQLKTNFSHTTYITILYFFHSYILELVTVLFHFATDVKVASREVVWVLDGVTENKRISNKVSAIITEHPPGNEWMGEIIGVVPMSLTVLLAKNAVVKARKHRVWNKMQCKKKK